MKKILIHLSIVILIFFGCSEDKLYRSDESTLANLEIRKVNSKFYPSIIFHNNSDDTIGIYASGSIRTNYQDTTKLIDRVLYDITLEIKQNGKFIKSTDFEFDWTRLDNRSAQLYILLPDSTNTLSIGYSDDLREDFKIRDTNFEIRAILDPPIEFLQYDNTAQNKIKEYDNLKIVKDIIRTPFVTIY